ncbi:cytidine and dCMP deaminase domain-containing protein 1 [Chanos chanos]|uniref:Cytidine and dCMP deaminase domain-containing protein 1 n=1 Tax=Chanos chanos TaxID=29144 RepID=A0A6J2VTY0_CHACN|nr:cytidine and dCMP deaminase domain-containing protein 1 [Chanos chanos]
METSDKTDEQPKQEVDELRDICNGEAACNMTETSTQTSTVQVQGHGPRLSKVNLFTLLSLWMELFPRRESQQKKSSESSQDTGLVVVHERRVLGLHCSGSDLHAGQIAVIKHGPRLKGCDMYFSRKPCSTCLKMLINAGVSQILYWPGDTEISLLEEGEGAMGSSQGEALQDAAASEKLRCNSQTHIRVLLQPLADSMLQFVEETSQNCDFMEKISNDGPDINGLFREQYLKNLKHFSRIFLISDENQHRILFTKMGLENFFIEPYFRNLRQLMSDLIKVLSLVAASVQVLQEEYGFYDGETLSPNSQTLSQDVIRHCVIQARLLSYRTEDHKVGVGAVIWAEGKHSPCDGTGPMYLVGCGYNAYPGGSAYAEYPQTQKRQKGLHNKYRYIIHAEQNALTFRSAEIKEEENTMLFVSKCPCDECVPLIHGAGIKQIYTSDLDSGKRKHDISYLKFSKLHGVRKFIWQKKTVIGSEKGGLRTNGGVKHRRSEESELHNTKRLRS